MSFPPIDSATIASIFKKYPENDKSALVDILHDIQTKFGFLPLETLKAVAVYTGSSESTISGVATFYSSFHLKPIGEHVCTVCMGTACHVRGSQRLLDELERDLGIKSGETTGDRKITLVEVNCVGACALGPLVIINGRHFGNMTSARLTKVVSELRAGKGMEQNETN